VVHVESLADKFFPLFIYSAGVSRFAERRVIIARITKYAVRYIIAMLFICIRLKHLGVYNRMKISSWFIGLYLLTYRGLY